MEENMQEKLEEIVEQKGYIAISLAYDLDEDRLAAIPDRQDQMPSLHCRRRKKEISKTQRNF